MAGPLSGFRILDLTRHLAGPFASMMLADMGAEVIKVEIPPIGDLVRNSGPYFREGESSYFIVVNRNKKSVVVDLKKPGGKEVLLDLASHVDVVFDNFRAGVAKRLGVDYATLAARDSRIVCCSVTGFGSTGPYAHKPGLDLTIQALSGGMSVTGEPGRPPVRAGIPIADFTGAMMAAIGIQSALLERERTGKGQNVTTSLLAGQISLLSYLASAYWFSGKAPAPAGSGHLGNVPYRAYATRDKYLTVDGHTEKFWPLFCKAIGMPELVTNPDYADREQRVRNRHVVDTLIENRLSTRTRAEWLAAFDAEGVPCAPVNDVAEALADPQVASQDLVIDMQHTLGFPFRAIRCPIEFSAHEALEYRSPPTLGQHTREVLTGLLGYPEARVDALEKSGTVGASRKRAKAESAA